MWAGFEHVAVLQAWLGLGEPGLCGAGNFPQLTANPPSQRLMRMLAPRSALIMPSVPSPPTPQAGRPEEPGQLVLHEQRAAGALGLVAFGGRLVDNCRSGS